MNIEKLMSIAWYIDLKPYTKHSNYDLFYLNICRHIFKILNKNNEGVLCAEDLRDMAYNITAYFEDVVNNIGFWKSLLVLNMQHFGKRLPFFPKEAYNINSDDDNDIAINDIHYLLFLSYVSLTNDDEDYYVVNQWSKFLIDSAKEIFAYLDEIEEVHITGFYESYLSAQNKDYIEMKKIVLWFVFKNYLTRIQYSNKMDKAINELIDNKKSFDLIENHIYVRQDLYTFTEPSNVTAYFPVDMLAGAMICTEAEREDIRNFKFRAHGIFDFTEETDTHLKVRHTGTKDEFDVLKDSFGHTDEKMKCRQGLMTLAKWRNDYNITGVYIDADNDNKLILYQQEHQQLTNKYSKAYRDKVTEIATSTEKSMLDFFGERLVCFNNGKDMEARLNEYNKDYFDKRVKENGNPGNLQPIEQKLPYDLLINEDIALFIPPKDNIIFVMGNKFLLSILQKDDYHQIAHKDINEALDMLFTESIEASYWLYLKEKFELPNLSSFMKAPVDEGEDFEALLRIYKYHDFSATKLPRYTISS